MPHIQIGHVAYSNESCDTYEWVMSHRCKCEGARNHWPWLIHMCAMAHSYVCHDSFICATWLIHMSHRCKCEGARNRWSPWSLAMPLVRTFSRTHTNQQTYTHTNSLSVRWSPWSLAMPLVRTFSLPLSHPHTYTLYLSLSSVIAMIAGYAVSSYFLSCTHTHAHIHTHTHSLFLRWSPWSLAMPLVGTFSPPLSLSRTYTLPLFLSLPWSQWSLARPLVRTFSLPLSHPPTHTRTLSFSLPWSPWLLAMPLVPMYVCVGVIDTILVPRNFGDMEWLRSVGSLKLQVSFAKEPYKRDDILQNRPII